MQNANTIKLNIFEKILIIILYLALLLTGMIPQQILSIIVLLVSTCFLVLNKPHFIFPVMLFYYSQLGILFGISTYRIFTILFMLFLFIHNWRNLKFEKKHIVVILIYSLYCFLTLCLHDFKLGFFALFDFLCLALFVGNYIYKKEVLKDFFIQLVIISIIAVFTGVLNGNFLETQTEEITATINYLRFMSTFNDPNYMGFFYTVAIFSVVCLKLFKKIIRYSIVILLYCVIISSLSVTAILANLLLWCLYIVIKSKIKVRTVFYIITVLCICCGIVYIGLYYDIPFLSQLLTRITNKVFNLNHGNIDEFTTYRTSLSAVHFEYFLSQSTMKQLFGGNLVNNLIIDLPTLGNSAAHNEYVDLLLNVGVIGSIALISYPIIRLITNIIKYKEQKGDVFLFHIIIKSAWLFYAASLTLFLDIRFVIFFLL